MNVKIHQLPIGARFEYEGQEYVKTAALFATGPGGQRLIPKYALLKPLDPYQPAPSSESTGPLPRAKVQQAFEAFFAECAALVPAEKQSVLDAARERFLKSLG
jgi:hypothetical protein